MLKITKFVDTIKEAVVEICEELRTKRNLSKGEIEAEKVLINSGSNCRLLAGKEDSSAFRRSMTL